MPAASFYNRKWDKTTKEIRNYISLPIEEKEFYRWIKISEQTKKQVPQEISITIIGDMENDIYEDLSLVPDKRTPCSA